eukprot:gene17760-23360_t
MRELENANCQFGGLRGGILADEPGLGKTVTVIALCLSTAGSLPKQPSNFWDMEKINDAWTNRLQSVKTAIWKCNNLASLKEVALTTFKHGKRVLYERGLRPSAGTLIIVPLVLLEHWYEQFSRHVGLEYLSSSEDSRRGVVYIDGLGDIVDVEAPLPKVIVWSSMNSSAEILSNYLFVITTFERCAGLEYVRKQLCNDDVEEEFCQYKSSVPNSNLDALNTFLGIRWLRLVIDEGHELSARKHTTGSPSKQSYSASANFVAATDLICDIAAERRWVMTGTPTTGTNSQIALTQLQKLLKFLRHDRFGIDDNKTNKSAVKKWYDIIMRPLLIQNEFSWNELLNLLKSTLVRHTKEDLKLFEPIKSLVVLDAIHDYDNPLEEDTRGIDRAMAKYISETILNAKLDYQRNIRLSNQSFGFQNMNNIRKPKAIVFSQHKSDLQGVGHFLYLDPRLGNSSVCEHDGTFKSAELSRFRHSKKKFRICPLCGHENLIINQSGCDNTLLLVEYFTEEEINAVTFSNTTDDVNISNPQPCEGGHGIAGKGGHFTGYCLCSPNGCNHQCRGYINALGPTHLLQNEYSNPNIAIISESQVVGWTMGMQWQVNQIVRVIRSEENGSTILWRGGQYGGLARIKMWRTCGGRSKYTGWHGMKAFDGLKWQAMDEDASILLLHKDGSHGLDLNFVTHIFLLEKIKDPALENQIISRAHRMGAKGPVNVVVLQVNSEK